MSDPKAQQEPTVEEILSSIRRIISEDQESEGEQQDTSEDVAADVAREPGGPDREVSEDDEADLDAFAEFAPSADELADESDASGREAEATGNVVDLAELDADSDSDFGETVLELTDIVDDESDPGEVDEPVIPEPESEFVMPEPEPDTEPESQPEPDVFEPAAKPEAAEPEFVVPEPEPERRPGPELVAPTEAPVAADGEVSLAAPEAALVSSTAAVATSTAFSQFALGVSQSQGVALGGTGRTLEELVKDLLRPMLKDWLDKNLPPLVQRLVEREISKLAGRADDEV